MYGEKPFWNCCILAPNQAEPKLLWQHWKQRFLWAMMAKHELLSSDYYFSATLTETQITALGDVGGKPMKEEERTLISTLYLCPGHEEQWALHNQQPHLDVETIRYPQFLELCVAIFKKERNDTYEIYQMMSRK